MTERFSNKELLRQKFGEAEKNTKTSRSTKRANTKVRQNGKYVTKVVDGVKYMILKG